MLLKELCDVNWLVADGVDQWWNDEVVGDCKTTVGLGISRFG